jgi:CBS domain-containing protein
VTRRLVKDVMLSLAEYTVVNADATVMEALEQLRESLSRLKPNQHRHRAVLVRDGGGRIIGKMGHLEFLRALLPEQSAFSSPGVLESAGVRDEMKAVSLNAMGLVGDDIIDICARARSMRVGSICTPATVAISEQASLVDAIHEFVRHPGPSLLVGRAGTVVGILRLVDLFDEFAGNVLDCAKNRS